MTGQLAHVCMFNRVPFQRSSMQLCLLAGRALARIQGLLRPPRPWLLLRCMAYLGSGLRIAFLYVMPLAALRYRQRQVSFAGLLDQYGACSLLRLLQTLVLLGLVSLYLRAGGMLQLLAAILTAASVILRILNPILKSCNYTNVPNVGLLSLAYERRRTSDLEFRELL